MRAPALLLATTVALAGCATAPLPALAPPAPAQWRHALPVGPPPTDLHGWWREFHDPQLDALVDRALVDNLSVARAVERLRAARTLWLHADNHYRPQLAARTDNAVDYSAGTSYLVGGFDASWEFGFFGRSAASGRVARGELESTAAELEEVRVTLVGDIVADWLTLGAAHERSAVLAQIRDQRQLRLEALRTRERLGLATSLQIAEAESAMARSGVALLDVQQEVDAHAQQLALLLGRSEPEAPWLLSGQLPHLDDWSLRETPADLLRTRPEIRRAEAAVVRAAGEAGLARAELLPSVGISGTLQWATDLGHTSPRHGTQISAIGPVVDIPLFDWGSRLARSRADTFQLQASVLAYREAVLEGVAETETALGNLQRRHEQEMLEAGALSAAERASAIVARRVELKLASPIDEQLAAIGRHQAQLEFLNARAARGIAYVALFKALGGAPRPPAGPQADAMLP